MKIDPTKLSAAAALTLSATVSAVAGSVTQPGETVGIATGAPLAPGWYFVDTTDWGVRSTALGKEALGVTIPVIAWSTPWTWWGARVQLLGAFPAAETGTLNNGNGNPAAPPYEFGFFNPFLGGQLAWDLGGGWSFSYLIGAYIGVHTPVSFDSTSLNQRFALSYTANGWNLTANAIWGIQAQQHTATINPDFVNLDLTATRKIDNWEVGLAAFYSTDVSTPVPGYRHQSQFALGPLVGYNFGPVILQAYLTRDVAESNFGGFDTRLWGRIIIPVPDPAPAATPVAAPLRR
jgi:hypothetical protein